MQKSPICIQPTPRRTASRLLHPPTGGCATVEPIQHPGSAAIALPDNTHKERRIRIMDNEPAAQCPRAKTRRLFRPRICRAPDTKTSPGIERRRPQIIPRGAASRYGFSINSFQVIRMNIQTCSRAAARLLALHDSPTLCRVIQLIHSVSRQTNMGL